MKCSEDGRVHQTNSWSAPFPTQLLTSHILRRVTNVFPAVYTAMLKHLRLVDLKYTQISLLFATVFNLNHIQKTIVLLKVLVYKSLPEK